MEDVRVGVFVCHCGTNIGGFLDVKALVEYAKGLPNVVFSKDNLYMCSEAGLSGIREAVADRKINRVVVASCTPRTHEPLFRSTCKEAGLNPYLFEFVNIREQCSWVHINETEKATEKAKDLIRMGVARARLLTFGEEVEVEVIPVALVIGCGIAGMTCALSLANRGFEVTLVEKQEKLGGLLRDLYKIYPAQEDALKFIGAKIEEVQKNKNIEVLTSATIKEVKGFVGNYDITVSQEGKDIPFKAGVIIVATGAEEFKPIGIYGYDRERVVTQLELEQMLKKDEFKADNIVMIQCVGARDEKRNYCSRICCMTALNNAMIILERNPEAQVFVLYRDMQTYGTFYEDLYGKARERGIIFVKYSPQRPPLVNDRIIKVFDELLGEELDLPCDLVVLSTPMIAHPDSGTISQMLKVPIDENGFFLEAHVKLRPLDFAVDGIYLCGSAHWPASVSESIAQAYGAASRASILLSTRRARAEAITAVIDEELCRGCGRCEEACEFGAIQMVESRQLTSIKILAGRVNEVMCKGCGVCAVICPVRAITMKHFTSDQILAQVEAANQR